MMEELMVKYLEQDQRCEHRWLKCFQAPQRLREIRAVLKEARNDDVNAPLVTGLEMKGSVERDRICRDSGDVQMPDGLVWVSQLAPYRLPAAGLTDF
jgi:hypothetical protein